MKIKKFFSGIVVITLISVFSTSTYAAGLIASENGETKIINDISNNKTTLEDVIITDNPSNNVMLFSTWSPDSSDTTEYFYDQLPDTEKYIYDYIDANIDSYVGADNPIKVDVSEINILASQLSNNEFIWHRPIYVYFNFDHPEHFGFNFLTLSLSYEGYYTSDKTDVVITKLIYYLGGKDVTSTLLGYDTKESLLADMEKMEENVQTIISTIPKYASRNKKLMIFNSWLVDNNTYNPYVAEGDYDTPSDIAWMISSALIYNNDTDDTKYPVCEGYSEALKYLCDKVGIPCMCIISDTHKWNLVQMEDGNWYHIDSTWNDPIGATTDAYKWNYFLLGGDNSKMSDSAHTINMTNPDLTIPDISTSDYTYVNAHNGDVNQDDLIDYNDVALMLKHISGKQIIQDGFIGSSDINKDNLIDFKDVIQVLELIENQ